MVDPNVRPDDGTIGAVCNSRYATVHSPSPTVTAFVSRTVLDRLQEATVLLLFEYSKRTLFPNYPNADNAVSSGV